MILKFTFLHKDSNKDFFLKIFQNLAHELDLKHYDMIVGDELLFFVNGTSDNLTQFATQSARKMPLSLYFIFKSVEVVREMMKHYSSVIDAHTAAFELDLEETLAVKDMQNEHFCDIFDFPKQKLNFQIFYDNAPLRDKIALKTALYSIAKDIQNGATITLKTSKGAVSIAQNGEFDFIMACDISSVGCFTRATNGELEALATLEKPLINIALKEVFAKELGFQSALFSLPYDPILCALCGICASLDMPLLRTRREADDAKCAIYYDTPFKERFFEIVVGENGYFIEKRFLENASNGDLIAQFPANTPLFIMYLSTRFPSILRVRGDSNNLIKIAFDKNPKHIICALESRPNGKKLIENVKKSRSLAHIEAFGNCVMPSENIVDIFGVIGVILGLSEDLSAECVLKYAALSLRPSGPRIDFKLHSVNGELCYDYISSISSALSFSLAGLEKEMICYGILDSLADFIVQISRDVAINRGLNNMGIIGDLFANKSFWTNFTRKIPPDLSLCFPAYIDESRQCRQGEGFA